MASIGSALTSWSLPALVLLAGLSLAGCGGSNLYPAQGKVIFKDGTPLTAGWVVFESATPGAKAGARGDIQPDGTFQLSTSKEGDGALEGPYRVAVVPPLPPGAKEGTPVRPLIHPRFQRPETSHLEFTVTPDKQKNYFTIVVDKP
jgi:hypothetical protein